MARPLPVLLVATLFVGLVAAVPARAGDAEDCQRLTGEAGIRACTAAIARSPGDANSYISRGVEYAGLGQHDRAIRDYEQAIALRPSDAMARLNRGNSYRALGDTERAIAEFGQAISLKPDYYKAFFNRGLAYSALGDRDRALADFNQAIALKSDDPDAFTSRGRIFRDKGDNDRAIADYDRALALKPGYRLALINRGDVNIRRKEPDRAIADFDQVIAQNPDDVLALFNRGVAFQAKSLHDRAIADYTRVIALKPDDPDGYTNRGIAYRAKGDADRALADYNKAIALRPADPSNYNNRGNIFWDKGDFDRALADYERAIQLRPDYAVAIDNRKLVVAQRDKAKAAAATPAIPAGARVALVIGNGAYGRMGRLRNPANDAAAVGKALTAIGFSVEIVTDANRETMARSLRAFSDKADRAEIAMVYYSGHAVQIPRGGAMENYLLPVDAQLSDIRDAEDEAIGLGRVMERVGRAKTRIVVLDACRDNPFAAQIASATRSTPARGLARLAVPNHGSLVVYSTAPQDVAGDGDGDLSPFTRAFVETVATKGLDARLMIGRVRSKVFEATGGRQTPYSDDGLLQEVYLGGQ
ncbi:hypothetical protein ABB55_19485 [Prosthecomicrobium hirschii]|uniref:Caspase family p20 domain-containing protein n=2 Tax=Prosthecodimorpha hirschii TaxID=665126 RepID=A0A0P6VSF2_9HYPH|nr:tetratricopeptide repeat protein [Prosthecomicrobium hirschii]KPL54127.1 hypothetical protein ABB55_19485 [Prosthecomicrobium hirschii]